MTSSSHHQSGRPIRVAQVHPVVPHYRVPLFEALAARPELDFTLFADIGSSRGSLVGVTEIEGCRIESTQTRQFRSITWDPGALRAARGGFDVLIMPWNPWSICLPRAIRLAHRAGTAVVLFGHGFSKNDNALRRWGRLHLAHKADMCLFYDRVNLERVISLGIDRDRVACAPNAIDQRPIHAATTWWTSRPEELSAFRARERLDPSKTILFVARVEPSKRVDLLLEGLACALEREPALTLVIVGDGSARAACEQRAQDLGIADSVRFAGAIYEEQELACWCLSAACMVFPSEVGLSLMHAFGYGLPMVTADRLTAHGPEIHAMEDDVNGLFFRADDVSDLAEKILRMVGDPDTRARLSSAAYATVNDPDGFTLANMVNGLVDCVQRAASHSSAGSSR